MRAPETRFLLEMVRAGLPAQGARGPTPASASGDMTVDASELDWNAVLAAARAHRLSSLVYEGARRGKAPLPPAILEDLRSSYYTTLALNLVLHRHLETILSHAAALSVPTLLLKGAALASSLYKNLALRPMADLDLLVAREQARLMVDLARSLGYERCETADHATSLRHRESGTYLEIHTSLTSCPGYLPLRTEELMARSEPVDELPEPARTLSPADHAVYVALHTSFQHGLRHAAMGACDLFLLARRGALSDERFFEVALQPRFAPPVYAGVSVAARLLPDEAFRAALERLRPRTRWYQRRMADRAPASSLLDPKWERRTPWIRILWASSLGDAIALVQESLCLPRGLSPTERGTLSLGRAWGIVSRHAGVAAFSRRALSPPADGYSPEPDRSRGWGPRDVDEDDAPATDSRRVLGGRHG